MSKQISHTNVKSRIVRNIEKRSRIFDCAVHFKICECEKEKSCSLGWKQKSYKYKSPSYFPLRLRITNSATVTMSLTEIYFTPRADVNFEL